MSITVVTYPATAAEATQKLIGSRRECTAIPASECNPGLSSYVRTPDCCILYSHAPHLEILDNFLAWRLRCRIELPWVCVSKGNALEFEDHARASGVSYFCIIPDESALLAEALKGIAVQSRAKRLQNQINGIIPQSIIA